jgi:hypothetical protein
MKTGGSDFIRLILEIMCGYLMYFSAMRLKNKVTPRNFYSHEDAIITCEPG